MEIVSKMQNVVVITFIVITLLYSWFVRQPFAAQPLRTVSPNICSRNERELYFAFTELEVRVGFTLLRIFLFFLERLLVARIVFSRAVVA